jgi:hypothetical protein
MLLRFAIIWVISLAAALAIGSRIPWGLSWRVLLAVPFAAEVALFSPLGNAAANQLPSGVQPMNIWLWGAIVLVNGIVFYGPSAVVLGGLGWLIVKAWILPLNLSKTSFLLLGVIAGALAGGCFEVIFRFAIFLELGNSTAVQTWVTASVAGGAAGGFMVAYYAATVASNGGDKASSIGNSHASV